MYIVLRQPGLFRAEFASDAKARFPDARVTTRRDYRFSGR